MPLDLTTLNENQLEAVAWRDGPLLVVAGPGSGKTRVLTLHIARLIEESPEASFRILALTFTNKAAAEMRERVVALVPNAPSRCLLTTFHSYACDLVRQHGHHLGLKPDFEILSEEPDRLSLLQDVIGSLPGASTVVPDRILTLLTRLIENDISPDDTAKFLAERNFEDSTLIADIYSGYWQAMVTHNTIDFPSLIRQALVLLRDTTGVKTQIQRVYKYICVDEFQDTNLVQYRLLRQLVNDETRNLFVVADDDQIIYQWNGASPERLKRIEKDFQMTSIQLPENYRCPPEVVEIANALIQHNFDRSAGKLPLKPFKSIRSSDAVTVMRFADFTDEASWIAETIASFPPEKRAACVVLARARKILEQICEALTVAGVSSYLAAKKGQFQTPALIFLHSLLRLANARSATEHLRRLSKAFYSLEGLDIDVRDIVARSSEVEGDLLRAWIRSALARDALEPSTRSFINTAVSALAEKLDFSGFAEAAFSWIESLPSIAIDIKGIFDDYPQEKETWRSLQAEIATQYSKDDLTLNVLLQELDLRSKAPPPPRGAVPCFTVHAAKGLEFSHVFLAGMVEDQLPSWAALKKGDESREMQEERRNCFVAITRAQETLTLTYSSRLWGWGKQPSRFLREMGLA
ncbi:MAG: ATP-dependent helicase UvrD/PcrA [Sphingomonadales bacterium]|nr:ATP-dependent helicase UvrD/PcrA [Sphingomonadales bacterium]